MIMPLGRERLGAEKAQNGARQLFGKEHADWY